MRHCKQWHPIVAFNATEYVDMRQSHNLSIDWKFVDRMDLLASPGWCEAQHKRLNKHRGQILSECVCYTCPFNTLQMGCHCYAVDGQT